MATLESLEQQVKDLDKNTARWLESIDLHLKTLNGQVAKNTAFRNKAMGGFIVLSTMGVGSIIGVILLWLRLLGANL